MIKKVSDLKGLPKDIAFVGAALVAALWAAAPGSAGGHKARPLRNALPSNLMTPMTGAYAENELNTDIRYSP
jgi:hypothetical protein